MRGLKTSDIVIFFLKTSGGVRNKTSRIDDISLKQVEIKLKIGWR